jgi:hypothetical protein
MALTLASAHLNDDDFLEAFHSCRVENSQFRHADHLRLAWIHLHRQPFEEALRQVRAGVQRFAAHHNAPYLYHETITVAWMRLLTTHHESTFEEFLAKSESRLGNDLLLRFWSPELLDTKEAGRHGYHQIVKPYRPWFRGDGLRIIISSYWGRESIGYIASR